MTNAMSEKERSRAKFLARKAKAQQDTKRRHSRKASRQEQHERYIDCGPLAWDDQTNPDY